MSATKTAVKQCRMGNVEAAALVVADVQRYGGEAAGLVQWARMVAASQRGSETGPQSF